MKIAVLSDIHGNYTAFKSVLEDAIKNNVTSFIIAGDHIGDGPQPCEVIDSLMNLKNCCVIKGNKEENIYLILNQISEHILIFGYSQLVPNEIWMELETKWDWMIEKFGYEE